VGYVVVRLETLEVCRDERGQIVSIGDQPFNDFFPSLSIDPKELYTPKDVAAILHVSYFTALRRMVTMPGVVDIGSKEKRFKRRKRLLRISGAKLKEWMRNHPANPLC
jgi:hypothetical protein